MRWPFVVLCFMLCLSSVASRVDAQGLPLAATPGSADPVDAVRSGLYTTVPVDLDGVPLFRVAARTDLRGGEISAVNRALLVDNALQQLLAGDARGKPLYDASTLQVFERGNGDGIVIGASDAQHPVPLTIVTVTSADAKYQQSTIDDVAASWQVTLQSALVEALRKRDPAIERRHVERVVEVAIGLTFGTAILVLILRSLRLSMSAGSDELAEIGEPPRESTRDYAHALKRTRMLHRLGLLSATYGVLCWLIALAWFIAATWALGLFSQTTALSRLLSRGGTAIGIIWIGTAMLNRFVDLAIARAAATWKIRQYLSSEERARILLRVPTAASAAADFKTLALIVLAAFLTLGQLGLPIGSVVTIGGVAALAITLGAQNFLKDVVGGIAVLYEDQYAIGDFVTIDGHTGLVEDVTLRMVRIRDTAGSVVTISHSSVSAVSNFSRIWSRIVYLLSIGPEADPDVAIEAIRDCVGELSKDPHFGESLLLPIESVGVDAFTKDWTLIRASIRTAPLRQFALRREINVRVRRRLAEASIPIGPAIDAQYIPVL
jgi:moderate conductance mechanosensitive channel